MVVSPHHPLQAVEVAPPKTRPTGRFRPGKSARSKGLPERLVVIGNGMVSHKLCERLVASGRSSRFGITIFGEELRPAYDRVRLTQFFGGRSPDKLVLAPAEWYRAHGIELHLGDAVTAVDRDARQVRSASGRVVAYDRLVFATGSRAFVPSIPGHSVPGVFVYRTIEDLQSIRSYAAFSRRAAVLGGGLLGLEAACALRQLGLATWIVERGSGLLVRLLDPEASALLRRHVERLGVSVCTGRETESVETIGPDRLLQFTTGECLRVQLVIVAAGIRPRHELAEACGLRLGLRGGIDVNDFLQTSDDRIYALGECASHRGVVYGLAAPGYQMADVLAATLTGRRSRFRGADQSTWLKIPGISVAALGDYQAEGQSLIARSSSGYRRLTLENNRLQGAVAIGEWPEQSRVREIVVRRGRVWRWQRTRFLRTGRLWRGQSQLGISQWPANALVCNCMNVRRGVLSAACAEGCGSVEQLAHRTGASTVCGSCRPLLAELVGVPAQQHSVPGQRLLLRGSLVALLLGAAIAVLPRLPASQSVQTEWRIEVLWFDNFWKQASGFTLLGVAALSLLLSVRKRFRWFQFGEVGSWRAAHTTLGALTLVLLVTHTGFRLGHNLNFVLMTNFLALALAGAIAGAVTALEQRLGPMAARQWRRVWTSAHLALLWPLPLLVLFHVLAAYFF